MDYELEVYKSLARIEFMLRTLIQLKVGEPQEEKIYKEIVKTIDKEIKRGEK